MLLIDKIYGMKLFYIVYLKFLSKNVELKLKITLNYKHAKIKCASVIAENEQIYIRKYTVMYAVIT